MNIKVLNYFIYNFAIRCLNDNFAVAFYYPAKSQKLVIKVL